MPKRFENLELSLDESLEEKLAILYPNYSGFRILKKSVDARRTPHWVITLEAYGAGETPQDPTYEVAPIKVSSKMLPVVVVGAGPAGLFAALRLAERGVPCILIEQGSKANERMRSIAGYWRHGTLNPLNNVCFGEGGAGLYSDGKLITRIRSPFIPYVLNRLVRFGAPEEITYLSNPHVGSDKIRRVIPPLREHLIELGCEVRFDAKVAGLTYDNDKVTGVKMADGSVIAASSVILATGHSATDMLHHLHENGVTVEGKSFAVGLRIEHPQKQIDAIQFGDYAGHPDLGAAAYRLADHDDRTGVGVYTFCMCPGGYVIASGTESDSVVSNGMSNYARSSPFANAAVVISIDHQSWFKDDLFGGLKFRRELELAARAQVIAAGGTKEFPAQRTLDFMEGVSGGTLPSSSPSGVVPARLDELFPAVISRRIADSLEAFDRKMPGFLSPESQLHGVESRTSCPVRVTRDKATLQSVSHANLYPTGEGAGYAGGITSAAVDGVQVAEAIVSVLTGTRLVEA